MGNQTLHPGAHTGFVNTTVVTVPASGTGGNQTLHPGAHTGFVNTTVVTVPASGTGVTKLFTQVHTQAL